MGPADPAPLADAIRFAFYALRLRGHLLRWDVEPIAEHPGGLWEPLSEGLGDTIRWLRARWRAIASSAVARRRPPFWEAEPGIDWHSAETALSRSGLSLPRQAAARSAMVGDSVTATRASHWRAISRSCPHCGCDEETIEHQLWHCPKWDAVRVRAAAAAGLDHSARPPTWRFDP